MKMRITNEEGRSEGKDQVEKYKSVRVIKNRRINDKRVIIERAKMVEVKVGYIVEGLKKKDADKVSK